jgi:hypothetical protein
LRFRSGEGVNIRIYVAVSTTRLRKEGLKVGLKVVTQNDRAPVDVILPYLQFGKSYCGRVRRLRDVDVSGYTSSRLCKREQD